MIPELKEALSKEKTDSLFFYFKHDGSIDFEKKVVAGQILHERGFYRHKLVEEKEKIVAAIEELLRDNKDPEKVKVERHKELKKGIIWVALPWLVFLFAKFVDFLFDDDWENSDNNVLLVFMIAFVIILVYRIITYRKNLKQFMQSRVDDYHLQKRRLKVIDEEWGF